MKVAIFLEYTEGILPWSPEMKEHFQEGQLLLAWEIDFQDYRFYSNVDEYGNPVQYWYLPPCSYEILGDL